MCARHYLACAGLKPGPGRSSARSAGNWLLADEIALLEDPVFSLQASRNIVSNQAFSEQAPSEEPTARFLFFFAVTIILNLREKTSKQS